MEAITLEGVGKTLGKREILKDIAFAVQPGDIFGFLGPNGAGKTTAIRIVLGILRPTSGRALILGSEVNQAAVRKRVGFVLEMDGLYDALSAKANLQYYAQIYRLPHPEKIIAEVLKSVDLLDRSEDKVGSFSKGMRQRLALARAFLHDPEVLVLDEPTSGVDPTGQIGIRQLILDKARKEGKTFFLSSHNLDEVQRICNRVALINAGRIKLCGDRDQLQHRAANGKVSIESSQNIPECVVAQICLLPGVTLDSQYDRTLNLTLSNGTAISDVIRALMERGVLVEQASRSQTSLEEIYTSMLKEVETK
jgi:ABC-2 type transport system ATP-binding protein